jgi:RNA polymerase primary sigma factor
VTAVHRDSCTRIPTEATDKGSDAAPEVDLTVEPSLDSVRLYLHSIGRVGLLSGKRPRST